MADVMLGLTILQVVTPVALAAMPAIWEQVVKVLKRIPRIARNHSQKDLECIQMILDSLEHMPDLSWTKMSHIQAHLNKLKQEAESLEKMIVNDNLLQHYLHKGKIAKCINSIALMMQLLAFDILMRRADIINPNAVRLGLQFYQKSKENLCKDLHAKLSEDTLEPVIIQTSEEYWASTKRLGTYPRIFYEFNYKPEHGYPRTLTTSRGVRECIELLLKWLRDLKLLQDNINTGASAIVGAALYELFAEILPKVLKQHLQKRRSKLNTHTAKQFDSNLWFFRSFSVSSTFEAIQGEYGLQLEDEYKICLDLRKREWATWDDVQQESSYTCGLANNPYLEVGTSSQALTVALSGNTDSFECILCGLSIADNSEDAKLRSKQHWDACFRNEQILNADSAFLKRCLVCMVRIDHLSFNDRQLHTNACLDRN